jgi:hypothetical protein
LRDNVDLVAATTSRATSAVRAYPTHCRRTMFLAACLSPFPSACPAVGSILWHRLRPRRATAHPTTAYRCNLIGRSPSGMGACASSCVMRYVVRGCVARSRMARVRSVRLRQRHSAQAEHRDTEHNAQHCYERCSARDVPRACAAVPLSVAPLRHHHHKFLRRPRSRRAFSEYRHQPHRGSSDSDSRILTATTLGTWSTQIFLLGRCLRFALH